MAEPIYAPDVYAEQQQIAQRKAIANALMQQGLQNQGGTQQIGGVAIRNSPISGLANMLAAYLGGRQLNQANQDQSSLNQNRQQAMADFLSKGTELAKTDPNAAMGLLASNPDTAPYAQALFKNQTDIPADIRTIQYFQQHPDAITTKQQLGMQPVTPYQQAELDIQNKQIQHSQALENLQRYDIKQNIDGSWSRIDKLTGQATKVVDPNAASTTGQNGVPLSGDDYLKTLSKPEADQIRALAEGRMQMPQGFALKSPYWQDKLMKLSQYDPNFDATNFGARQQAQKDWAPGGKDASMYRSIGTASKHLDMMGDLIDALDNGNVQTVNRVANLWKNETGGTAPSNFNAAKEIVGQEVVKSIVANGGGVSERQEAAAALAAAKTPAQLKGVIQTYRTIMDAQKESLLQQRRAAGLKDETLPDYTEQKSAPTSITSNTGIPDDIQAILNKHGKK